MVMVARLADHALSLPTASSRSALALSTAFLKRPLCPLSSEVTLDVIIPAALASLALMAPQALPAVARRFCIADS